MVDKLQMNPDAGSVSDENNEAALKAGEGVTISHRGGDTGVDINIPANADSVEAGSVTPEGDESAAPVKPDWAPEKFWDAEKGELRTEDLAKSYAELEKGKAPDPDKADEDKTPDGDLNKSNEGEPPADQPNAIQAAQAEWAEKGELTGETYESLASAGLDKATVDNYIAGAKLQQEAVFNEVYSLAGGTAESYAEMMTWAAANLSDAEKASYDKTLDDPAARSATVEGMYLKYQQAANAEGTQLHGAATSASPAGSGYSSSQEMMKDMSSPQYKTDKAFQAKVAQKIKNAEARGVNLFA